MDSVRVEPNVWGKPLTCVRRFSIELQLAEDEAASLLRLRQQLPCIQDVKRFLMWFVASSKGQLRSEEGITINSAISYWQQLSGMFRNRCGQSYDKATFEDVRSVKKARNPTALSANNYPVHQNRAT